jgi:hypothetical protein
VLLTVNAKEYARWLLGLPLRRKMPKMRPSTAFRVSRFLSRVASHAQDCELVHRAADNIWRLPQGLCFGPCSTKEACLQFLRDFGAYLAPPDLAKIIEFVESLPAHALPRQIVFARGGPIEYRSARAPLGTPAVSYLHPGDRRKWPAHDLTERICRAHDALKAARCRRPSQCVASLLQELKILAACYCTVQHVESRLRVFPNRIPETEEEWPMWLRSYWQTRDPQNLQKGPADPDWPDGFVFEQCDC